MKKLLSLLIIALALILMVFIVTSCSCNGNQDDSNINTDSDSDIEGDEEAEDDKLLAKIRAITKIEVVDGSLLVTFADTPKTPVNVGKVSEISKTDEETGLTFYPLGNDTYGVSAGTNQDAKSIVIPQKYNDCFVFAILPNGFSNCSSLESITIPKSVTYADESAFIDCQAIKEATIPTNAISLMPSTLQKLVINGGKELGDNFLSSFTSLKSINLSSSVLYINSNTFVGCSALTSITVDENNPHYKSINDNLYTKDGKALVQYAIGKTDAAFEISSDILYISSYAFSGCALTSIVIPSSVTAVEPLAFADCINLASITISSSATKIAENAFSNCSIKEANVPAKNIITIPRDSLEKITINDSEAVELFVLSSYPLLKSISVNENNELYQTIDDNLYSKDGKTLVQYAIGKTATSFEIPDGVTTIGHCAFYGCSALEAVTIPSTVTTISNGAFGECVKLSSVTIPSSVTTILSGAFYGCDALTSIIIPSSVTSMMDSAFENCSNIKFYCEAKEQPSSWGADWNDSNRPVEWGYTGK